MCQLYLFIHLFAAGIVFFAWRRRNLVIIVAAVLGLSGVLSLDVSLMHQMVDHMMATSLPA